MPSQLPRASHDPVFVFTDPGIDDALALAMLAKFKKPAMVGACGVDGNVPARIASENLAKLFALLGAEDVPIFESTIDDPTHEYPTHVHGKNGLGNVQLVKSRSRRPDVGILADYLKSVGRFQILSLGPLTAVAELIESSPEILKQVSQCVIMGGGIAQGNVTPYAEFNVYSNPEAANVVFRSLVTKLLVPLDVTEKVCLYPEDLAILKRRRSRRTRTLAGMLQFYFNFQKASNGFYGGYMHDPSAVVAMTNQELFEFRRAGVRVDTTGKTRGRTVATFSSIRASTWVALKAHEDQVRSFIMSGLLDS
jgi:purine nucleosidase